MVPPELVKQIHDAVSWWRLACVLVEAWRLREDLAQAPWTGTDDDYDAYGKLMIAIEQDLGGIDPSGPTRSQQDLLCEALGEFEVWRHAGTIDAVDRRCHPLFCIDWAAERNGPFTLQPGELYPIPSWEGPPAWKYSRNPTNLARRPWEFPHIRVHELLTDTVNAVEIVFDPTAEAEVAAALTGLRTLATVHPNEDWAELSMSAGATAFPVAPAPDMQSAVLMAAIRSCLDAAAQVVVLPELSVTEPIADELRAWLLAQEDCFAIVVIGSQHTSVDGEAANISQTLIGPYELTHRKIVPFTSEGHGAQPSREGIVPGPRRVRVLVAAGWRFAVLICKDFLDADVRRALERAGVNVLAVPAMSAAMESYPAEVDGHVLATQGSAIVANNPGRRPNGTQILPAYVFGQPSRETMHVAGPLADIQSAPFVALFDLGDQEARCVAVEKMLD
jgi:predicted amidohydrolase